MTVDALRKLHRARPFQPFELHLADERTLPVEQPGHLLITRDGRTVGVGLNDDTIESVDSMLVTSLRPRSNGG